MPSKQSLWDGNFFQNNLKFLAGQSEFDRILLS